MRVKHPVISVTGSSGAGTSTVKHKFEQIFRREGVAAATIEGDAFHRYDRAAMKAELERRAGEGDQTFSHFSLEANELKALKDVFRSYGATGTGKTRASVHDGEEAAATGTPSGEFTPRRGCPRARICCSTRAFTVRCKLMTSAPPTMRI
jgi:phosphoribulokinase